jgi:hypothetical protein
MKRLDQGHPNLEVRGLTSPGRASMAGGEHSRKEPFEQLFNSYSEHLCTYEHDQWRMLTTDLSLWRSAHDDSLKIRGFSVMNMQVFKLTLAFASVLRQSENSI